MIKHFKPEHIFRSLPWWKQLSMVPISQLPIFLKKQDVAEMFEITPEAMAVFLCRHKNLSKKVKVDGKDEVLLDFFASIGYFLKHTKRMAKKPKKKSSIEYQKTASE